MKISIHLTLDLNSEAREAWVNAFACDNTAQAIRDDVKSYLRNQIHTDGFKDAGIPGVSVSFR